MPGLPCNYIQVEFLKIEKTCARKIGTREAAKQMAGLAGYLAGPCLHWLFGFFFASSRLRVLNFEDTNF
jgi:hypothetical protein